MNQEQSILDIKALLETTNSTNGQLSEGIAGVDTSVTELGHNYRDCENCSSNFR